MGAWIAAGDDRLTAAAPPVPLREIVRRFRPFTRRAWRWLPLVVLLIALGPAIEALSIWLFKAVVDQVLVPRTLGPLPWLLLAFVGATLLGGVVSFADNCISVQLSRSFVVALQTGVFRHLHSLGLDFFERRSLGDILTRLTGDVEGIETLLMSGVGRALVFASRLILFGGALFLLRWDLALVSMVVVPAFWLTAHFFSRRLKQMSRERRRRSASIASVAEESIANTALVQAYNRQEQEVERLRLRAEATMATYLAATRLRAIFTPVVEIIELGGVMAVFALGTWELSRGLITVGGLIAFVAFLAQLYAPIRGLAQLSTTLQSATASAERIIEVLDQRPSVVERPDAVPLAAASGYVSLDNVSFRYAGASRDALSDVSFEARPGETIAIMGPSGAGKSTVAKLLLRFHDPSKGTVRFDGHDLRDLSLRSLRDNIALLLQETLIFDATVAENIACGANREVTPAEIVAAAAAAGADSFIETLPDGYLTLVGQKGSCLSGGERQRIALARAFIRNAPLLILDEPTTGLDPETVARITVPLRRLMATRTTIVISHDLLIAGVVNRILVLEDGRIREAVAEMQRHRNNGMVAAWPNLRHSAPIRPAASHQSIVATTWPQAWSGS